MTNLEFLRSGRRRTKKSSGSHQGTNTEAPGLARAGLHMQTQPCTSLNALCAPKTSTNRKKLLNSMHYTKLDKIFTRMPTFRFGFWLVATVTKSGGFILDVAVAPHACVVSFVALRLTCAAHNTTSKVSHITKEVSAMLAAGLSALAASERYLVPRSSFVLLAQRQPALRLLPKLPIKYAWIIASR